MSFLRNLAHAPIKDFFTEVSRGKVAGSEMIYKFGENPSIASGDGFEDVTDIQGKYTFLDPGSEENCNVASDNAADAGTLISSGTSTGGTNTTLIDSGATFQADGVSAGDALLNDSRIGIGRVLSIDSEIQITSIPLLKPMSGRSAGSNALSDYRIVTPASTGASVLYIFGLSAGFVSAEEFVILNGTSDVATSTAFLRQFRGRIFGSGSANNAVGTIISTAPGAGVPQLQIINGNNQTLMALWTVPVGKCAYLRRIWGSMGGTVTGFATLRLRIGEGNSEMYIVHSRGMASAGDSDFEKVFDGGIFVPAGIDILIEASTNIGAGTPVSAGFDILFEDA